MFNAFKQYEKEYLDWLHSGYAGTNVFTQDFILRDTKKLPLYEKIVEAHEPKIIVLPSEKNISPRKKKEFSFYCEGKWYLLSLKK